MPHSPDSVRDIAVQYYNEEQPPSHNNKLASKFDTDDYSCSTDATTVQASNVITMEDRGTYEYCIVFAPLRVLRCVLFSPPPPPTHDTPNLYSATPNKKN